MAALAMPIFNNIRNINFFNGRLLTATDLSDEQIANRRQREQVGQAIGAGVAYGLEIALLRSSTSAPKVSVQAGLALNAKGQALTLATTTELTLTPSPDPVAVTAGLFHDCPTVVTKTPTSTPGIALLVLAPASGYAERAPMRGLDDGSVRGCGDRYAVEGVQFRLVDLDAGKMAGVAALLSNANIGSNTALLSKLRNLLAHFCFGTPTLSQYQQDPFRQVAGQSAYVTWGAIDELRKAGTLTECDVPLALLYRTAGAFHFADNWAVRRRLTAPMADRLWPLHSGERHQLEAEAIFLQFQEHLVWLRSRGAVIGIAAQEHFRYLPPVGYLPIGRSGFMVDTFFKGLNYQIQRGDPAFLRQRVDQALQVDPIDLVEDAKTPIVIYGDKGQEYVLFVRQERREAFR